MDTGFEHAPIGILEVSPDGVVRDGNDAAASMLAVDAAASAGEPIDTVFPASVEGRVPQAFETPPDAELSFVEYYPELDRWLAVDLVPGDDAVYVYLRDETDGRRREQRLDSLRSDLRRLTIGNELIADVLGDLVGASTREEIAETICRRLGGTDIYAFAWVGERAVGSGEIVLQAAAGTTGRTLEQLKTALDGDADIPELRTIERGAPTIVGSLGEDKSVPEDIRRAAFADGLGSLLAVPLTYGSSVYGVVGIYAAERNAFSERERESFGTVGEMAGFAINATRNRSLLSSERVVELTFRLADPAAPLVATAAETDARIDVTGVLAQGEELRCYVDADTERSPDEIGAVLADHESVIETRTVAEYDGGGSIEVVQRAETPLGQLLSQGGTVQSATFGPDGDRVVVDLPPSEDVRRIADAITRRYDAAVIAKRERRRDERTTGEVRDSVTDRLTDRQEEALRTAFFANYFESPRGSSAEEVADALGITGPTLLHHLRAGQRKLLADVFEATDRRPDVDRSATDG
ncbi:Putative light- and oxygen-sensing transcriptionregulator [Halorhabdus sp. SVX81]|uniref:bacterio-opsin activator domain-containing protein n=1 Tax=Halorhabdus sp. SVX81 TaxID=2978283 RepID=UPI0023DA15D6|nr:bacterio-opsin activator domain-containing protein [Halorhabdus sp. SVX81]WEL18978.1 Putative light- and oxygen-sensing transcriptionregulator [Halorhabdus sp. SVX81]